MRTFISIILVFICFIIPLNFFVLGEGVGYGFQGTFYQYKVTGYGSNLFTLTQDLSYIINGNYTGRTMMSTLLWAIGSVCIIIATIIWIINSPSVMRLDIVSGILLIFAGLTYLFSVMFQYGIFLHGSAGLSIPFGIPLLICIGFLMIKYQSLVANKINQLPH